MSNLLLDRAPFEHDLRIPEYSYRAPETTPRIQYIQETGQNLEWISSDSLAEGFAEYNYNLGIDAETQRRYDQILWELGMKDDSRTADHCRRTGGYAGALVRVLGGTTEQELRIRLTAGLHDEGKCHTDDATMHRSWGDEGWGKWEPEVDMPNVEPHAEAGCNDLKNETLLPPETKFVCGCHHQYPERGKPAYGVAVAEIDREYPNDSDMRNWTHWSVFLTSVADKWEAATHRRNGRFPQGSNVVDYMLDYLETYLPDQGPLHELIIRTLQDEQRHYLRPSYPIVPKEALFAA